MITFGALVGHDESGDPLGTAELAEAIGFDSVWVGDHVLWHVPVPDPMVMLGAMAVRLERIRLGVGILLAPLRPATVVAKQAATVDQLSGGRLILGVGVGGEFPIEYEASGVPLNERGRRLDETIEACKLLWTGRQVSYSGRHLRFQNARLDYLPVQVGGPPVWVGGRSDAALRRAGQLGDGWLAFVVTPDRFATSWAAVAEHARLVGRDPSTLMPALQLWCQLAESEREALAMIGPRIEQMYRTPYARFARYCITGDVEVWIRRIEEFVAAGVRHFNFVFAGGDVRFQMIQFADSVLGRVAALA
ncbi:MAG: LLM class flavin-dependent oxidoreductase [Dehalococcoidia bacterium]